MLNQPITIREGTMDQGMLVVIIAALAALLFHLSFQLWLARRDARLLRQIPVVVPQDDSAAGCLVVLLAALLGGLFLLSYAGIRF